MKIFRFFALTLVITAFTFPPTDVKFQYEFKVGDEYSLAQHTTQTIKQSVMGMEQTVDNLYEGEFQLKVNSVDNAGAKIQVLYKRMKNVMKSPMGETSMDSESPNPTNENKIFKSMVNKAFFITMNKRGEIVKLEGTENLWSDFGNLGLDENAQKTMRQSLEQFMGESAIKSTFETILITYPDRKIKQGDSWKSTNSVPMNFPMSIENTWSVDNLSNSAANLVGDGIFSTTDKEKRIDLPGGFKAKTDLSGKQAMKSSINVKTGWPTKLDILSELKGTMTLLAGGMIPEDMDVPMEILSETTYTIVKK